MNAPIALSARPTFNRRRLWIIASTVMALGAVALSAGAVYVFSTQPQQVAVTDTSGVAHFNFRVTGIPVPGVVSGVKVQATWNPNALEHAKASVTVPLKKLSTGIQLRDEHAKNYLGVGQHPVATFKLDTLEGFGKLSAGQRAKGRAKGIFNLNGVDHPLNAPTTLALDAAGQKLEVTTHFDVAFSDYHISIPGADPKTDVTVQFRLPTSR